MKRWLRPFGFCAFLGLMMVSAACQNPTAAPVGENPPAKNQDVRPAPPLGDPSRASVIIVMTEKGFSPQRVTITKGMTVTWVNKGTELRWPASNDHPIHANYPEKGGCIGSKFDACNIVRPGESYSFAFTHVGTWHYHDHLKPELTGTIIVK